MNTETELLGGHVPPGAPGDPGPQSGDLDARPTGGPVARFLEALIGDVDSPIRGGSGVTVTPDESRRITDGLLGLAAFVETATAFVAAIPPSQRVVVVPSDAISVRTYPINAVPAQVLPYQANRVRVTIINRAVQSAYILATASGVSSDGFELAQNERFTFDTRAAFFAVCAAGETASLEMVVESDDTHAGSVRVA